MILKNKRAQCDLNTRPSPYYSKTKPIPTFWGELIASLGGSSPKVKRFERILRSNRYRGFGPRFELATYRFRLLFKVKFNKC